MASHLLACVERETSVMAARRWVRRAFGLGLLAGAAYAVWRAVEANRTPSDTAWEPQPFPFPPQPRTTATRDTTPSGVPGPAGADDTPWVEPIEGACPASHPVKAKLSSKIFHVPGGQSYDRTVPDRCYLDPPAAEADDFRQAKR
jgi:hypothetical protein